MESTSDQDGLELESRTWKQATDTAAKLGFREGMQDGSSSVFQQGFDKGYQDSFKIAFMVGAYKGFANTFMKDVKHPTEIETILSSTKNGICSICETQDPKNITGLVSHIECCQEEYANKTLKRLEDYFDPFLTTYNVDLNTFKMFC